MKKNKLRIMICIAAIFCLNASTVYAKEYNINGIRIEIKDESVLLPEGVESSRDEAHNPTRGSVISTAMTGVENDGNGDMTFTIDTMAHVACDEIRHKAYVDVWNESTEEWDTIETVLFVATRDMVPEEPLYALNNSFTMKKMKVGNYYRVSGAHLATLGETTEYLSTSTDGVKNEIH